MRQALEDSSLVFVIKSIVKFSGDITDAIHVAQIIPIFANVDYFIRVIREITRKLRFLLDRPRAENAFVPVIH